MSLYLHLVVHSQVCAVGERRDHFHLNKNTWRVSVSCKVLKWTELWRDVFHRIHHFSPVGELSRSDTGFSNWQGVLPVKKSGVSDLRLQETSASLSSEPSWPDVWALCSLHSNAHARYLLPHLSCFRWQMSRADETWLFRVHLKIIIEPNMTGFDEES